MKSVEYLLLATIEVALQLARSLLTSAKQVNFESASLSNKEKDGRQDGRGVREEQQIKLGNLRVQSY